MNISDEYYRQRIHLHGRLSLAGKIKPHLSKLYVEPSKWNVIGQELMYAIDLVDVVLLFVLSVCAVPIGRILYQASSYTSKSSYLAKTSFDSPKKTSSNGSPGTHLTEKDIRLDDEDNYLEDPYESSTIYAIAHLVQQVARLAAIVYWFDCALVVLQVMGFSITALKDPSGDFTKCLFTTWGCFQLMRVKRFLLGEAIQRKPDQLGKVVVFDRIVDVLIYLALSLAIMDTIQFQIGPGLGSLFAFGGLGTFIFGMASKDIASHIVSGISVTTSEKFHVGEDIQLGDSTRGIVEKMGWLYTELRGQDEVIIKIPNNQLTNQRISNLSRMNKSQVKVNLRISYDDLHKIPKFISELKVELSHSCQYLITDGSRPFRVNWRGFESDHLLVVVDTRHRCKPTGDIFYENQESVLQTIAKVALENRIVFSIPSYDVRTHSCS